MVIYDAKDSLIGKVQCSVQAQMCWLRASDAMLNETLIEPRALSDVCQSRMSVRTEIQRRKKSNVTSNSKNTLRILKNIMYEKPTARLQLKF